MKQLLLTLLIACIFSACASKSDDSSVSSPDSSIKLDVGIENGRIFYSVEKNGKTILNKSFLGLTLNDGSLGKDVKIKNIAHANFSEQWNPVWGEEKTIDNTYNQLTLSAEEQDGSERKFDIVFRVFNDGFGFRYEFPKQDNLQEFVIMDENTEFNFPENHKSWSIPYTANYYEALFEPKPINELDTVSTPLTIETNEGLFLALHEANLTDYAAMNIVSDNKTSKLKVWLTPWSTGEKVFVTNIRVSPWRTLIVADKAGDLLLSRLMLNLNEPSKIEDTSWIKTGRYIGIWWGMHTGDYTWLNGPKHGATTQNAKTYIDFAAKHDFAGVLIEGWNWGWENDWTKEGDKFSFTKAYPDFDLDEITAYAKSKGVQLIGHHETGGMTSNYENQMDSAFALYQRHGVHAVKTGYVGNLLDGKERHSSQYGVRHYRKVIETAAKYHIMIDNHEPVMPTGLQRTYPNLVTQEGVRGQEWDAWDANGGNPPEHTTIIPFTRGLAGPMDFTPGTFKFENPIYPQTRVWTTLAKQLALSVVIYSPWQMASDMIENYEKYPKEFEFITSCPTDWSKTTVPDAKIGEYITIARKDKNSDNWYVGSITNMDARELSLTLDFLDKGASYTAKIFEDGENANYKTDPYPVKISELVVNSDSVIRLSLAPGGGTAIIITKN